MRTVDVPLGDRSYPILVGDDLLRQLGRQCAKARLGPRCAIVSDRNVARRYGKAASVSLRKAGFEAAFVTVPAGETSKSLKAVQACCDQLAAHRLERNSFIVALGGGVVGDLAGFLAAIYLRGIDFVQVPTTLLAQVDSSVGGKVGVNLPAGKNLVGSFYQPRFVMCDLDTLKTLPEREYRSGLAEVIKYRIIHDRALFDKLERDLDRLLDRNLATLTDVISQSCEIKAAVVGQDERERGLRAILNFGHTIGHGLEAISGYGTYLHGEAISIGQVAAAKLSVAAAGMPVKDAARIEALFRRAGLPVAVRLAARNRERLMDAMRLDKKVSGGEIRFVLAPRIGYAKPGYKIPTNLIMSILQNSR